MSDQQKDRVAQAVAAEKLATNKVNREKRAEKANIFKYLILTMVVVYFADILMLDNVLFAIVGFFATLFDAVFESATMWVSNVKASIGSVKWVVFTGAAAAALFLTRQRA